MPKPIPSWKIPSSLLAYLAKRQLAGETTTLRQMSWRMGIGSRQLIKMLVELGVDIYLNYTSDKETRNTTQIILMDIPLRAEQELGISGEKIRDSFSAWLNQPQPEKKVELKKKEVKVTETKEEIRKKERYFLSG
jgi:hypothetical protein